MKYRILVLNRAVEEIQQAVDYYEKKKKGLSLKFEKELDKKFKVLESNPKFKIEYKNIHCMPLKKFPFLIHFRVNDSNQTVTIEAIFNTNRNPEAKPNI